MASLFVFHLFACLPSRRGRLSEQQDERRTRPDGPSGAARPETGSQWRQYSHAIAWDWARAMLARLGAASGSCGETIIRFHSENLALFCRLVGGEGAKRQRDRQAARRHNARPLHCSQCAMGDVRCALCTIQKYDYKFPCSAAQKCNRIFDAHCAAGPLRCCSRALARRCSQIQSH